MKDETPKLSLVVIAYNEEDYIGGCLESIAEQTVAPDEVIVVNNNSTDNTAKIAASFPFARVVKETNQGIAFARNRGFNEAKFELIARIDADTKLPPEWVKKAHEVMDKRARTIAAASGPAYIHDMPLHLGNKFLSHLFKTMYFTGSRLMMGQETLFGSNTMLTKTAWEKVKNEACTNSHEVHEDMDLAIHIAQYGDVFYDKRLRAGIARRAFEESLKKRIWRVRIWPKTASAHGKLFTYLHPKKK